MKASIVLVACLACFGLPNWTFAADKYLVVPTPTPARHTPIQDAGVFVANASNGAVDTKEIGEIDDVVCFLTQNTLKGNTNYCTLFSTNGCVVQAFTYGWYLNAHSCPGSNVHCVARCIKR